MLFINYKYRVAMINRGHHLKVKQAFKKNLDTFGKKSPVNFCLGPKSYFEKGLNCYLLWFFRNNSSNLQGNPKEK